MAWIVTTFTFTPEQTVKITLFCNKCYVSIMKIRTFLSNLETDFLTTIQTAFRLHAVNANYSDFHICVIFSSHYK